MSQRIQKKTIFIYKSTKILEKNQTDPTKGTDPTNGTITITTIFKTI